MLATKGIEWAYEKEWRLVDPNTKGQRAAIPAGITLGSIILGLSTEPDVQDRAIKKAQRLKIPVFFVQRQYPGFDFGLEVRWPQ